MTSLAVLGVLLRNSSNFLRVAALLNLAAEARAALRRSRGLAQVLVRLKIEVLFALGAAEIIRLPFVLGTSRGGSRF